MRGPLECCERDPKKANSLATTLDESPKAESPHQENIQALSAAALHRACGFAKVLDTMRLYRQDCTAGVIHMDAKKAFDSTSRAWMHTVSVLRLRGPDIGESMCENGRRQTMGGT